ncbi:MAG: hypothetical protein OEZ30_01275 [Candidatus Aminicenantes bacterium]|nr:hypothetical protein [Candidatus Aminicenantes bacterium]MDH5714180.1 hypothetical protein [Candidatus Aminicenantes bacterium]
MRKYRILITSFFLLLLATGLYGESDDQPKWNTTLFESFFLDGGGAFGIGGAVGYSFISQLELEGEVYYMFTGRHDYYGMSAAFISTFDIGSNHIFPYILGGVSLFGESWAEYTYLMWGGGMKWHMDIKKSYKIRFDSRFYLGEGGLWMKFSIGLMWTF